MTQQSALFRDPISTNRATAQGWQFNLLRAPSLSYFCKKVKLPKISLSSANELTPFLNIPSPGDHLTYSPVVLTFDVDQNFQNWQEIFNWMRGIADADGTGVPYSQLQYAQMGSPFQLRSDMSVIQMDSQNNPILHWDFHGAYPSDLESPEFDSTNPDVKYLTSTVIFEYVNFDVTLPV